MLDRLYKKTATGAVQRWDIETDIHRGCYRTISGQLGGKAVTSEWTQCKPKNVGRANTTTAEQQCLLEAEAAWKKKLRDGYSILVPEGDGDFQCMLAKEYKDPLRKKAALKAAAEGNLYTQPKLDGVRLIARRDSMMSRKNRPIVAVPHIEKQLRPILERHPGLVTDGELYSHDLRDDFDELVSIVRKTKPKAEDLDRAQVMQYWVYDCAGPAVAGEPFSVRFRLLLELFADPRNLLEHVRVVQVMRPESEHMIDDLYSQYLSAGYEGQMLRIDAPYENKRSDKLLKRKEFEDAEFTVIAIREGEGNRSGQAGYVVVQDGTKAQFKAGIKAELAKRLELLKNKEDYEGWTVTIRFNGKTPSGVPRFPRAVAWFPGTRRDV